VAQVGILVYSVCDNDGDDEMRKVAITEGVVIDLTEYDRRLQEALAALEEVGINDSHRRIFDRRAMIDCLKRLVEQSEDAKNE
jgi:hypothetical protein